MSVMQFTKTPFFANKNGAFWRLQIASWIGYALLRTLSGVANAQPLKFLIVVVITSFTGFSISLILSVIYRLVINRRPLVTWGVTFIVLALAVVLYSYIDAWVIMLYRPDSETSFTTLLLGLFFLDLTVLGAWSALYYAINFFLQVEQQTDMLSRLENQATSAQLAMLRYQLNPHFLFNTLNSISTLVLLKQTDRANEMLTRLSSFLRYTLVNTPGGRVTLAQEVATLKLYLDIERMRFEERLRAKFEIDPATNNALLPSLLLQPLLENAIKYAVSPQEEGAEIMISAQAVGNWLRITVSDTGPGLGGEGQSALDQTPPSPGSPPSTGVGLVNIRDRLSQAYGEEYQFEILDPDTAGFAVRIELPLEMRPEAVRIRPGSALLGGLSGAMPPTGEPKKTDGADRAPGTWLGTGTTNGTATGDSEAMRAKEGLPDSARSESARSTRAAASDPSADAPTTAASAAKPAHLPAAKPGAPRAKRRFRGAA